MANSVDPDQTAPIGAVCSGSTLFSSILNSSVMLGNYLQQTPSADDIFKCIVFLAALRVNKHLPYSLYFRCSTKQCYSKMMLSVLIDVALDILVEEKRQHGTC